MPLPNPYTLVGTPNEPISPETQAALLPPGGMQTLATAQGPTPPFSDLAKEAAFQKWFAKVAAANGLDPNPDAHEHHYDMRGFYQKYHPSMNYMGSMKENGERHFTDEFKLPGHPDYWNQPEEVEVNGVWKAK
jgi:hypothetical protein